MLLKHISDAVVFRMQQQVYFDITISRMYLSSQFISIYFRKELLGKIPMNELSDLPSHLDIFRKQKSVKRS
jgi:hypothetical protein